MDGSALRYIEEFGEAEERPIYLPGDTICLRLRISHSVNLGGVWAVFRRLPERGEEESADPYITLPGKHYRLSQAGPLRTSEVYFEFEVSRGHHAGDYELEAVRAYPYDLDGRDDLSMEFEVRGEIGFRIVGEIGAPSPRVTGWKFD